MLLKKSFHFWWKYTTFLLVPVRTTPEEFGNEASVLRLDLPPTLICHENEAFRKQSSNRRNLKTPALRFRVDGKRFLKTKLFVHDDITKIILFPGLSFSETQIHNKGRLLYSWRFSRNSAPIHWLVHGHMTSNNETVSRQMP